MSATAMSSQAQPLKVFLCHGWGDTGRAGTLPPVNSDGFRPWLDEEELIPGHRGN